MTINENIQAIAAYTQSYLNRSYRRRKDQDRLDRILLNAEYRWQHTLRVAQFGKVIAEKEGADIFIVTTACLLHDIAWFKTTIDNSREHGRLGAKVASKFLGSTDLSNEQVSQICYAIASHVDVEDPDTLEARILSDADNIDRFGPFRVLQWCIPDLTDYQRLTDKLNERINRLEQYRKKNPLFTRTGQQLFEEQLNLQINYFRAFVGEKGLTTLPQF